MQLSEIGKNVNDEWINIQKHFFIDLDQFQIMPNHIHGIINLKQHVGVSFMKPENATESKINFDNLKSNRHMGLINQTPTIGHIIRYFKSKCSHEIHQNGFNQLIWQRNYYEHIVRDEGDLCRIREYINSNIKNWTIDKLNIS